MFKFLKMRGLSKQLEQAAADGRLTDDEYTALIEEAERAGLGKEEIDELRAKHLLKRAEPFREIVRKTRRLSKEDYSQLSKIAKSVGASVNLGEDMEMARALWANENGFDFELREIVSIPVLLQKNEVGVFSEPTRWRQFKTVKKYQGYSGLSANLRIAKGLSYRVGNVAPKFSSSEQLVDIADGNLVITSKRLIFNGGTKSTTIALNKIVNADLFVDGISISKTSGRDDVFILPQLQSEFAYLAILKLQAG
jgi:hypothetical protein